MTEAIKRVALLTGCGEPNGIGNASAMALARRGTAVVVSDRTPADSGGEDGIEVLASRIVTEGGDAMAVACDLRSEAEIQALIGRTVERYGRLDIIVNNAAAPHGADRDEIDNVPMSAWDDTMAVNARAVFLTTKAALPHMRHQGWGRIINVASAIVTQPRKRRAIYAASKGAVVAFTQGVAIDVAEFGITVNAVCPGSVLTARARSTALRSGFARPEDAFAESAKTIPAGRHGMPEDIAEAILFIASEHSGYLTGQTITIDGGGIPQYKR